mmetsp:Transcript_20047/g.55015  ORF Transcript_20047/g.55015 Transcript_20047/m.55015 type:complete len:207 (-) Transcript_20047:848-1468(-)
MGAARVATDQPVPREYHLRVQTSPSPSVLSAPADHQRPTPPRGRSLSETRGKTQRHTPHALGATCRPRPGIGARCSSSPGDGHCGSSHGMGISRGVAQRGARPLVHAKVVIARFPLLINLTLNECSAACEANNERSKDEQRDGEGRNAEANVVWLLGCGGLGQNQRLKRGSHLNEHFIGFVGREGGQLELGQQRLCGRRKRGAWRS